MKGFNTHRHKNNPQEMEFHDKFIEQCSHNHDDMDFIVFGMAEGTGMRPADHLTDREKRIAISTIQWLGSPVGQNFLRDCGYVKTKENEKA